MIIKETLFSASFNFIKMYSKLLYFTTNLIIFNVHHNHSQGCYLWCNQCHMFEFLDS